MYRSAYLAPDGFTDELLNELQDDTVEVYEHLVLSTKPAQPAIWADNIWLNPQAIKIESIGDAAQKLKAIQRNWANYAFDFHRRSSLITEKLPHVSAKPIKFPSALPTSPLGSWALLAQDTLLASPSCSSPYPNGAFIFEEDKTAPSRAYLKLWETLMRLQKFPKTGETCLDLGASPGGWTWVLQKLGANVISVDKAPLDPMIEKLPGVSYKSVSAFALEPAEVGPIDWLFSDIICYPERALRLIENWKKSGLVKNIVSTIKFQGETDHETVKKLLEIPSSSAVHLYNNKHEITWFCLEGDT